MKLFSSTQISWSEPWFFLIRIRKASGWRRRLLLALAASVVMLLVVYYFGPGQRGLPEAIGISLAAGFVLVALLDVSSIQRDVTVQEDRIVVSSSMGRGWFHTLEFESIASIQLIRPGEWNKPYGGMAIGLTDDTFLVAVPKKVSLDAVANILHRLGLAVSLADWQPSDSDTRIGIRNEIELDPAAVQGEISIEPIGNDEAHLLAPVHIAVQVVIALGPLLLALIGAIVTGVVLYRSWADTSVLDRCLYGGGALIGVVVTFVYLLMIGQFIAAAYGIRVARGRLRTRPNAMVNGMEDDLVCVEIFDRESWTATVSQALDYGFLRLDREHARLVFEGNKFRWVVPTSALTACRIEESIVGNEGNPDAEKRYYVVIAALQNGDPWESGMVYTRTELGSDTSESRYKRAQQLFTQLAELLRTA